MSRVNPFKRPLSNQPSTQFRRLKKGWVFVGLVISSVLVVWGVEQFLHSPAYRILQDIAFAIGDTYDRWFSQQTTNNPALLIGLAFLGGLVASISPCILSLLPVNLSYIGTREIHSRRDALIKASSFVLGVVVVLSLLGLFSSFAGFVFVQFRGYFHLLVGAIIVLMGLSLAGVVSIPLPKFTPVVRSTPAELNASWVSTLRSQVIGPFGVGLTFALVSSPCTSPVMVSVLAAASATGSQVQSTLTMISYALGYTAIIFIASLFTGLAKQTRGLLAHSDLIIRVASMALLLVGLFYLITGGHWVLATFR